MFVGSVSQVARSQRFSHPFSSVSRRSAQNLPLLSVSKLSLSHPLQKNTHLSFQRRRFTSLAEVGTFMQANSQLVYLVSTVSVVWLSGWRVNRFLCRHIEEVVKPMFTTMQAELGKEISGVRVELGKEISGVRTELGKEISDVRTALGKEISDVRTELGKEISGVRTELGKEISDVRTELGKEISDVRTELGTLTVKVDNLTKITDKLEVQVNGLRESIEGPNGLRKELALQSGEFARFRDKIEGPESARALINGFKEKFEERLSKQERDLAQFIRENVKQTDPLDKSPRVVQKAW